MRWMKKCCQRACNRCDRALSYDLVYGEDGQSLCWPEGDQPPYRPMP